MLDVKLKLKPGHTSERAWMESSSLRTLFWNVTYGCNFRCQICFTDSGKPLARELTTSEAKEMVSQAIQAGVKDILISGGEPFLRPDLIEILIYMASHDVTARIASNGSLLTREILLRLRNETLVKSFQISLDTTDLDLYAEFHGVNRSLLPQVLQGLRLIQENGFHTTVSARLTPRTLPGIPRLLDLALEEGWSTVTIHWPLLTKRVAGAFPQDEDFLSLMKPVFEYFCALPERWLVETYIPWAGYHPAMKRLAKSIPIVHRGCRAGRDRLTVNPTGQISPCVCLDVEGAYMGNIRSDNLSDTFQNSAINDLFRNPEKNGICSDCPAVLKCGGGCRAAAFATSQRLDSPDKSCPLWKRRKAREQVGQTIT